MFIGHHPLVRVYYNNDSDPKKICSIDFGKVDIEILCAGVYCEEGQGPKQFMSYFYAAQPKFVIAYYNVELHTGDNGMIELRHSHVYEHGEITDSTGRHCTISNSGKIEIK